MSIQIIEGKPRTGKSYFLVWMIATTYFNRDKKTGNLTLKDKYKDLKILSNITKLKIPHDSLEDAIEKAGGVSRFFSKDFQEKIYNKYPQILYVIDESQDYFPKSFKDQSVFSWFRYHGHWGQEIILACHGSHLLPSDISSLADSQLRTMPQALSFFFGKDLKYSNIVSGEKQDTKITFKRNWVFDLYQSQETNTINRPKNVFLKYILFAFILIAFGAWNAKNLLSSDDSVEPETNQEVSTSQHPKKSNHRSQKVTNQQKYVKPEKIVRYKVSFLTEGSTLLVFYNGEIYDMVSFPYPIEFGPLRTLYALVPESELPTNDQPPQEHENGSQNAPFSLYSSS